MELQRVALGSVRCLSCAEPIVSLPSLHKHSCKPDTLLLGSELLDLFSSRNKRLHCKSCQSPLGQVLGVQHAPCLRCSHSFAGYIQLQPQSIALDNALPSPVRRRNFRRAIDSEDLTQACQRAELALSLPLSSAAAHASLEYKGGAAKGAGAPPAANVATNRDDDCTEELCCTICCELLCEPVSLLCGHSYCGECYDSFLAHRFKTCPLCRKPLPSTPPSPNIILRQIIKQMYPIEYERRCIARKPKKAFGMHKPASPSPALRPVPIIAHPRLRNLSVNGPRRAVLFNSAGPQNWREFLTLSCYTLAVAAIIYYLVSMWLHFSVRRYGLWRSKLSNSNLPTREAEDGRPE